MFAASFMKVTISARTIFLFIFSTLIILKSQVLTGCANIIPPTGGPRDSMPPVLVEANPNDSTTNFKGNRITLTFDEYIDLQEVHNNLLFTPIFENVPVIEARLRTLTIRMRDTLEPNTTYTFNFGKAIKDVNEGNVAKDFAYTFSTGPYLDSLQIRGSVIMAETGKIDSTLMVVLHTSMEDSAVVKQRPRYATRLDNKGNFVFRNLPNDTFAIYAIGDAGLARRYTSASQAFAFADTSIIAGTDSLITLYAYQEEQEDKTKLPAGRGTAPSDKRLRYTTNLSGAQQNLTDSLTLTFDRPLRTFDSTKISLRRDSSFTPVGRYRISLDSTQKMMSLQTQWQENTQYHLVLQQDFAEDTLGQKLLKEDTINFTTRRRSDYGSLRLRIRNIDTAANPVLQFVQSDKVVYAASVKTGFFAQPLFLPGDYELRLLYDRNNNLKWDAGQFFGTKRQPELVIPIERTLSVKPDWENEAEITVPAS